MDEHLPNNESEVSLVEVQPAAKKNIDTIHLKSIDFDQVLIKNCLNPETHDYSYSTLDSQATADLKTQINSNRVYGHMSLTDCYSELLLYSNSVYKDKIGYIQFSKYALFFDGHRKLSKIVDSTFRLLSEAEKIDSKTLEFYDASKARKMIEYCISNNILYQDGIKRYSKWQEFDGDFTFSYAS